MYPDPLALVQGTLVNPRRGADRRRRTPPVRSRRRTAAEAPARRPLLPTFLTITRTFTHHRPA